MQAAMFAALMLASAVPPSLMRMVEQRRQLRTAELWWSRSVHDGPATGETLLCLSKIGSNGLAAIVTPSEDTPARPSPANPNEQVRPIALSTLWLENEYWSTEDGVVADRWQHAHQPPPLVPMLDPREIGLLPILPGPPESAHLNELLRDPDARFRESAAGELYVAEVSLGKESLVWHIDPAKDWNPVRCEKFVDGALVRHCELQYAKMGSTWFPALAEYFTHEKLAGSVLVDASSARFNEPDLPQRLCPADIEIVAGTNVHPQDGPDRGEVLFWTGTEAVTPDTFREMLSQGTVERSPIFERNSRRVALPVYRYDPQTGEQWLDKSGVGDRSTFVPVTTAPGSQAVLVRDPWDVLVDQWILSHKPDKRQAERAHNILRICNPILKILNGQLLAELKAMESEENGGK